MTEEAKLESPNRAKKVESLKQGIISAILDEVPLPAWLAVQHEAVTVGYLIHSRDKVELGLDASGGKPISLDTMTLTELSSILEEAQSLTSEQTEQYLKCFCR